MNVSDPGATKSGRADYEGRSVLVTGADGFIGSHLTEALVEAGANVTALCLYNAFDAMGWIDDLPKPVRASVNAVRGDVRDAALMQSLAARQEVIFHLAALIAIPYSYAAAQSYVDTNILGTLNVLEAARAHDVARLVHTSTSEVYGSALVTPIDETHRLQGQSPYSATKIGADMLAEAFARSHDVPVAILRPFNTYGPRQSERAVIPTVIRQALDPEVSEIRIGDTSTVRDFTFVEDTAAAFIAIGAASDIEFGRPYNAGTGRSATVAQTIELIVELSDCRKPVRREVERLRPERSEVRELLADHSRLTAATAGARAYRSATASPARSTGGANASRPGASGRRRATPYERAMVQEASGRGGLACAVRIAGVRRRRPIRDGRVSDSAGRRVGDLAGGPAAVEHADRRSARRQRDGARWRASCRSRGIPWPRSAKRCGRLSRADCFRSTSRMGGRRRAPSLASR